MRRFEYPQAAACDLRTYGPVGDVAPGERHLEGIDQLPGQVGLDALGGDVGEHLAQSGHERASAAGHGQFEKIARFAWTGGAEPLRRMEVAVRLTAQGRRAALSSRGFLVVAFENQGSLSPSIEKVTAIEKATEGRLCFSLSLIPVYQAGGVDYAK